MNVFLSSTAAPGSFASALLVVAVMIAGGALFGGLSGAALSRLGIRPAVRRGGDKGEET